MIEERQEEMFDLAHYTVAELDTDQYEMVYVEGYWRRKKINNKEKRDG